MAEQTSSSIQIDAPPEQVMEVIADFASYPEWATGVQRAEVQTAYVDGTADEVEFSLNAGPIKDTYTLAYTWEGTDAVHWTLVQANVLKAMDGSYILKAAGGGTDVTYKLAVDVTIPMIGMLKRKAEKVIIETALKGLKQRVESMT